MWRVILGTLRQRLAHIAFERGGLVVVAALVVYVAVAPSHVVDPENAHFVALGQLGGVAHPSGYPLFVLWLRATSWLPGTAAHAAALATIVLAITQLAVLHAACRAWGARATSASLAVAMFAAAPFVIGIYTEAEVFALNGLAVACVLWLAAAAGPVRGAWRCAVLGLVAGLGLANHLTCALVAPLGVLGVVRGVREAERRSVAIACAAAGLALGLAPYLYLVIAPDNIASWGRIDGVRGLIDHVLRREYGFGDLRAGGDAVPALDSLAALARSIGRTWLWLPALAGGAAVVARCVRSSDGEPRWGWAMLLASFALAGPMFIARFNIAPVGVGRYITARFHVLPAMMLTIPIADAFDRAGTLLAARWSALRSTAAGAVIATCAFVAIAVTSLPSVARAHSPAEERQLRDVLAALPRDAVILGDADDLAFGIPYVQLVLHERTDVTYVQWSLMKLAWYRARLAERGVVADLGVGGVSSVQVVDSILAGRRPVFVQMSRKTILETFPHYPYGIFMRVLPQGAAPPAIDAVFEDNKRQLAELHVDYPLPGQDDAWATEAHRRYAFTWDVLARELDVSGKPEAAAWAREASRAIGPQP